MKKTKNEMRVILNILKSPEKEYNANNLSKVIEITPMGVLKILKRLEKEEILVSRKIGNASIYKINFKNEFALEYITFLLKKEAEQSPPYIKRWIYELKKMNESEIILIFGSVLKIKEKAKDIDVLFVVKQNNFNILKKKIEQLNKINEKKIHPIYQTFDDFKKNIIKQDKVILSAIKGVVLGDKKFIHLIQKIK